jgi:hypothetical protein
MNPAGIHAERDQMEAGRWPLALRLSTEQRELRRAAVARNHQWPPSVVGPLLVSIQDLEAEYIAVPPSRLVTVSHEQLDMIDLHLPPDHFPV